MAKQKKLEQDAKKAYKKAVSAVDEAKRLAENAGKKPRAKVEALAKQVEVDLKKSAHKKSAQKITAAPVTLTTTKSRDTVAPKTTVKASPKSKAAADYTPPLPHARTVRTKTAGGGTTQVELGAMSIIALRTLAKSKGLTGYTRLNKAALIERLEQASAR